MQLFCLNLSQTPTVMKYLYTSLLIVCCSFATAFAQPTFTITPSTTAPVDPGETITFDVTVSNFTNILSIQFNIEWDPTILGFISVDNPNSTDFPGLGTSNFGANASNTDAGRFSVSWFEGNLSAVTVPDGTRMFSFSLSSVAGGSSSVGIATGGREVIDGNEQELSLDSSDTSITVNGGTGPTCTDGIQNGDETGVDCGGSCAACTTTPTCTDGIQNGDETGVDCGGSCAPCTTTPTCTDGMQNGNETGVDCGGNCPPCNTGGGDGFGLIAASRTVMPGEQFCLDITTQDFTNLVGMQFSLNWDNSVLQFDMVQSITNIIPDFVDANIGLTEVNSGAIRVQWNPNDSSQGYMLPDGTILFQVCFTAIGSNGTSSSVSFTNSPLSIEVLDVNLNLIDPANTNGLVSIQGDVEPPANCPPDASPFCIANETAGLNETICVAVTAQNFNNIASFQHSMNFDANSLEFVEIINSGNLPGLADANFNLANAASGSLAVSWVEPNIDPLTLANGTELYQICFILRVAGTHTISFGSNPVPIEITDGNSELAFNGANGSITLGDSDPCATAPAISITGTVTDISCRGESTGAIDLSVSGGSGSGYTFAWSTGPTSEDLSNVTAGSYTVMVSNACGDNSMTFMISEPTDGINLTTTVTSDVNCAGEMNGAIEAVASGGTGNLTFAWTGANVQQGVGTQSGLAGGSYTVTVTDGSGCTVSQTVTVSEPAALSANPDVQDVGCGGTNDGSIDLNLSGGTAGYTVNWNDGGTGEMRTGLGMGDYTPTVMDANGCTLNINTLSLSGMGSPISVTSTNVMVTSDMNGEINLMISGGTAPYTVNWTGPGGFFADNIEDLTGITSPGVYVATITDANGCTFEYTESLAQPIAFSADIQNACDGGTNGSITVLVSGGVLDYTYNWTNAGNTLDETTGTLAGVGTGTYILEVTDAAGTVHVESFTVEVSEAFSIDPTITNETMSGINDNGAIALTVSGGSGTLSYTWSDDNTATTASRTDLSAGDYMVTISDANGCTQVETFTVGYEPSAPEASGFSTTDASCDGVADGSLSFSLTNGDPNYVITLLNTSTNIPETETLDEYNPTYTRTGLAAGRYDITIVDANGLEATTTVTIAAPEAFSVAGIVASATDEVDCNGTINLNVSGGSGDYMYEWSNEESSRDLLSVCPGDYMVTITDSNGCSQVESFNLTLFFADGVTNPTLCPQGDATGNVDLNVNGGLAPFTYSWTGPEGFTGATDTEDLIGVPAGEYTVVITDAANVAITQTFTVGSTSSLAVQVMNDQNQNGFGVSCNGSTDAALIAIGQNSDQYAYVWRDAAGSELSTTANLSNVGAGTYSVEVTDNQNCVVTSSIEVIEPTALSLVSDILDIECSGDGNGEIMIVADGGVRNTDNTYNYTWSHDADNNFPAAIGLLGGTYVVTVTDANNCTIVDSLTVSAPDSLTLTVDVTPFDIFNAGSAIANVMGGTPPYRYNWTQNATGEPAGVSTAIEDVNREMVLDLQVTDINGCTVSASEISIFNMTDCLTSTPVITPNGDGLNELFVIQCLGLYPENKLEIYSRWGQLVHEQAGYDNTWDARDANGQPLPAGAYFYVFSYTDQNGNDVEPIKGAITILNRE